MIKLNATQRETIDRLHFYGRLTDFIADYSHRADFKAWASDTAHLHALWDTVWTQARDHSEHECALFLVFLAICAFEGRVMETPGSLLDQVARRIVALKLYISENNYFFFTAFDYPNASQDEGLCHV